MPHDLRKPLGSCKALQPLSRHRWFDPWMGAGRERIKQLVRELIHELDIREAERGTRTRRRRETDERNRAVVIEVISANLTHAVLLPSETGRLAVLTGNNRMRSRYTSKATGKLLREVLDEFEALDLLDRQLPSRLRGEASSIAPSPQFLERVLATGVTLADIGRIAGEELILLKRTLRDPEDEPYKICVEYMETTETTAMRETMRELNSFLADAEVTFENDGQGLIDTTSRTMKRHFLEAGDQPLWSQGGRLYGGFWQNLATARRKNLRIEGEEIAILDFSSMFPRLVYASMGLTPPMGDIYEVPGIDRDAVKILINTMFNDTFERKYWPKDTEAPKPRGWSIKRMRDAIAQRHPALEGAFGSGNGNHLMNTESRIMVAVLVELRSRGIAALGLHDGLLAPCSRRNEVKRVMEDAAYQVTGTRLPVGEKVVG